MYGDVFENAPRVDGDSFMQIKRCIFKTILILVDEVYDGGIEILQIGSVDCLCNVFSNNGYIFLTHSVQSFNSFSIGCYCTYLVSPPMFLFLQLSLKTQCLP